MTARASIARLVCVTVVVWAMPTHYAARLLLDTDPRRRGVI
jgi:hypothetical protein